MLNWFKSKAPKEQLIAGYIRKKYTLSDDGKFVLCSAITNSTDAEDIRALVMAMNEPDKWLNRSENKPNYNFMNLAGWED